METEEVFERARKIIQQVAKIAADAGRNPDDITLVAVSKKKPVEYIRAAYKAGIRNFGENYPQELAAKAEELSDLSNIRWHMIGHLQRNKVKLVAEKIVCLHSLDSIELAKKLNKRLIDLNANKLDVLVMVNIGKEPSKHGIEPNEDILIDFLGQMDEFEKLNVKGLMCLPPFMENPEDVRPFFKRLREMRNMAEDTTGKKLPELSMGMSHDFAIAIEEGSTMVRIGTSIFGRRD